MTYDPLKLCEDMGDYFEADPAVVYPATVARIQECIAGAPPTEIMTPGWTGRPDREPVADRILRQAEDFPSESWELALMPLWEPEDKKKGDVRLEFRANALAFAESWFKRALSVAAGRGIRIHFSRNLDFKR